MSALRGLLRKEVLHILRDRRTLTVLVLLPVVQVFWVNTQGLFGSSNDWPMRREPTVFPSRTIRLPLA